LTSHGKSGYQKSRNRKKVPCGREHHRRGKKGTGSVEGGGGGGGGKKKKPSIARRRGFPKPPPLKKRKKKGKANISSGKKIVVKASAGPPWGSIRKKNVILWGKRSAKKKCPTKPEKEGKAKEVVSVNSGDCKKGVDSLWWKRRRRGS